MKNSWLASGLGAVAALTVICGSLLMVGCGKRTARSPAAMHRQPILASTPVGFAEHHIGRPHDEDFQLLRGKDGKSLFNKRQARKSPQNKLDLKVFEIGNEEMLKAHASAWGIVSSELGVESERTFVTRRLTLVKEVLELDENTGTRSPPEGAAYYPWRVYLGWSIEVVCSGSANTLSAEFKAAFLVAEGGVEAFSRRFDVECEVSGHGVSVDKTNAIFAKSMDEIEDRFRTGTPVPILVEWVPLEGVKEGESKVKQGCAGESGCLPCEEWDFSALSLVVPSHKQDTNDWDGDSSPPDVIVTLHAGNDFHASSDEQETYKVEWDFDSPIRLRTGDFLTMQGIDKDAMSDDPIRAVTQPVPGFLEAGTWRVANGLSLQGRCVGPK